MRGFSGQSCLHRLHLTPAGLAHLHRLLLCVSQLHHTTVIEYAPECASLGDHLTTGITSPDLRNIRGRSLHERFPPRPPRYPRIPQHLLPPPLSRLKSFTSLYSLRQICARSCQSQRWFDSMAAAAQCSKQQHGRRISENRRGWDSDQCSRWRGTGLECG